MAENGFLVLLAYLTWPATSPWPFPIHCSLLRFEIVSRVNRFSSENKMDRPCASNLTSFSDALEQWSLISYWTPVSSGTFTWALGIISRSFLTNSYIDVWIIWKSVAIFQMDLTELHLVCCFTFLMISFIFYDLGKLDLGFLETVQALFSLVLIL